MPNKLPVCINIDDHCPLVHVYHEHLDPPFTGYGAPLKDQVPLTFAMAFRDVVRRHGIKGKLSYIPAPGCLGDVKNGLTGFTAGELKAWRDVIDPLTPDNLSFGAEMLTHHWALNLLTGTWRDENEDKWSRRQTRGTMTPYIANALRILRDAGVEAAGVTSPWMFGENVEEEYQAAIAQAIYDVKARDTGWYFMRSGQQWPEVYHPIPGFSLVHISATISDNFWPTLNRDDGSDAYVKQIADRYLSEDGKTGLIPDVMAKDVPVVILCHWQSLFSNGYAVGLRALDVIAGRINALLSDRLEWMSFTELADLAREREKQ